MDQSLLEISETMNFEMESIPGLMEQCIKETGRITKCMEKEKYNG